MKADKKIDHYIWSFKSRIGSGPYGEVYKGKDLLSHEPVTIKIIPISHFPSKYLQKYISSEVASAKNLSHPNLVKIYDVFFTQKRGYIISEYCKSGNLRTQLLSNGILNETQVFEILEKVLLALKYLHDKSIINRDLKPENILFDGESIKISDYLFMKNLIPCKSHQPLYLSPQVLKSEVYTSMSDIWSFGLIYYEMLFGKLPWNNLDQIIATNLKFPFNIQISHEGKSIIKGCLEILEIRRWELNQILRMWNSGIIIEDDKIRNDEYLMELAKKLQWSYEGNKKNMNYIFENNEKKEVIYETFKDFMFLLDKNLSELDIKYLFQKLKNENNDKIKLLIVKQFIEEQDFGKYEIKNDPFLEEKAEKVVYCLKEIIIRNKLNIDEIFDSYDSSGNASLDIDEFFGLVKAINPFITKLESK